MPLDATWDGRLARLAGVGVRAVVRLVAHQLGNLVFGLSRETARLGRQQPIAAAIPFQVVSASLISLLATSE
jgi:hypothetical protein